MAIPWVAFDCGNMRLHRQVEAQGTAILRIAIMIWDVCLLRLA